MRRVMVAPDRPVLGHPDAGTPRLFYRLTEDAEPRPCGPWSLSQNGFARTDRWKSGQEEGAASPAAPFAVHGRPQFTTRRSPLNGSAAR